MKDDQSKEPAQAGPDEVLPEDRSPDKQAAARRIARLEELRRVLLVLGTLLLIAGYASALKPLFYGCVAPLTGVMLVSWRIKRLEEGRKE